MIKVFNGGYEVAEEYYFQYESNGTEVYDSKTRVISGLLHVRGLSELEQLDFVNGVKEANLVILEPTQAGYMTNLLGVKEVEFTKTMSNTESIYRITGAKRMKPKRVDSYKVSNLNGGFGSFMVDTLVSVSVDEIIQSGNIRTQDNTDIRYLWASDTPVSGLTHEIGKCRIESGHNFYITQTGGSSHKMQMPSLSGIPFPNNVIKFVNSTAEIKGKRLELSLVNPNLLSGTKDWSGSWSNLSRWYDKGEFRGLTVKSLLGTYNYGLLQSSTISSDGYYTFSSFAKTDGSRGELVMDLGSGATAERVTYDNTTFKRVSITRELKKGDTVRCYARMSDGQTLVKDAVQVAGYKLEKGDTATSWVE